MSSDRQLQRPAIAWSLQVGVGDEARGDRVSSRDGGEEELFADDQGRSGHVARVDRVSLRDDGEAEFFADDEGRFGASSHRARVPAWVADALLNDPDPGAPSAHDGQRLAFSQAEWTVHTRGALFGPFTPATTLLLPLLESAGLGMALHRRQPTLLRALTLMLSAWIRRRGTLLAAEELLQTLSELVAGELAHPEPERDDRASPDRSAPGGARPADATDAHLDDLLRLWDLAQGASSGTHPTRRGDAEALKDEVLGVRRASWWRRRTTEGALHLRVQGGLTRFQPDAAPFPLLRGDLLMRWRPETPTPSALLRMLPPWTELRLTAPTAAPTPRTGAPMSAESPPHGPEILLFHPTEGSLLDQESLGALATLPGQPWVMMSGLWMKQGAGRGAGEGGLVLSGLTLDGTAAQNGPPGAIEPTVTHQGGRPALRLRAGLAWTPWEGEAILARVGVERGGDGWVTVSFPEGDATSAEVPKGDWALVLELRRADELASEGNLRFARLALRPRLALVRASDLDREWQLCVARSVSLTRRWETDLSCLWQPEDARARALSGQLRALEESVWRATPAGAAWAKAVLGRDWLRYQAAAAAALQAAGLAIDSRPMSTAERVRLLESLTSRLTGTVPEAAARLVRLFGPDDAHGPYAQARRRIARQEINE